MFLTVLLLLSAMALSTVAGFYSVAGMTAIFAASWWPIVIMTGTLEFSKIVVSSWLYRNWDTTPKILKIYFTSAVLILMFITSLGIFGYLSKAHIDQLAGVGDNPLFIKQIDQQISTEQARVDDSRKVITQMDSAVSSMLSQSTSESAQRANKGVSMAKQANLLRDSQKKDRNTLNKAIDEANSKINELNKERLKLEQEQIKIEAEVGPIKYIAQMIYGDNPDKNLLEKSVRYIIILIITVFDPLAVLMFIAANMSLVQLTDAKEQSKKQKLGVEAESAHTSVTETVHIDKININMPTAPADKDIVESVIHDVEEVVDTVSNVAVSVMEETIAAEVTDVIAAEEVIDPVLEEPIIEKKDELTDVDSITVEDLIILQEPITVDDILESEAVIEEPITEVIVEVEVIAEEPEVIVEAKEPVAETVIEEVIVEAEEPVTLAVIEEKVVIAEPVTESIVAEEVIEEEVIEEEVITEPVVEPIQDSVFDIKDDIEDALTELSDSELEFLIDQELEIIELSNQSEYDLLAQEVIEQPAKEPDVDNEPVLQVETLSESVDYEAKEVILNTESEVVEESVNEITYIDGQPITQFLDVQNQGTVDTTVQAVPVPNQKLQFAATPAIVRKPDDILSTIKRYHNVRLDDAKRTLR